MLKKPGFHRAFFDPFYLLKTIFAFPFNTSNMTDKKLRIIFMGTPEFAVPSLQQLIEAGFNVVAVITAPDKPKGRGKKLGTSPVKDYALSQQLPVLQPVNLKDPGFQEQLRSFQADLQVVVAFRMLPEAVWSMPPLGSFNLHASLLPQYRGAAPINWAIINGEQETGVTTFMLKHEIDTGNILFQEKEPIHRDDNVGTLYERLMKKGAELVVKTARAIEAGNYELKPQAESQFPAGISHAPKIFKETCEINWEQPAEKVRDFIRGLSPYPAAWTTLDGKIMKVYAAEISPKSSSNAPGTVVSDGKTYLAFRAKDRLLELKEVQLEGKKRMETEAFLRGFQFR